MHHHEAKMDKLWDINAIGYYITLTMKKAQLHTTWMNLTNLMDRHMTHKATFKQEFMVYDSTM